MDRNMHKDFSEIPLSESNVSLRLADIRRRCYELIQNDEALELSLEEPARRPDGNDPYDLG
ncbi:MAG: hypothetical protein MJA32_04760 [Proteobacteria bacterium]|nr:hypothetical protein [Pseudomonadota bacterium]